MNNVKSGAILKYSKTNLFISSLFLILTFSTSVFAALEDVEICFKSGLYQNVDLGLEIQLQATAAVDPSKLENMNVFYVKDLNSADLEDKNILSLILNHQALITYKVMLDKTHYFLELDNARDNENSIMTLVFLLQDDVPADLEDVYKAFTDNTMNSSFEIPNTRLSECHILKYEYPYLTRFFRYILN